MKSRASTSAWPGFKPVAKVQSPKILLVGPCPPPHGGISVHVAGIRCRLEDAGVTCDALDTSVIPSRPAFARRLFTAATKGWQIQLHTNGHNPNSWVLALLGGIAGKLSGHSVLTLHSGMMPEYARSASGPKRWIAALACRLYSRIVCVGVELQSAVVALGAPADRTEISPAYIGVEPRPVPLEPEVETWLRRHYPVLTTAMFFRPEYGFDLLIDAVVKLREENPHLGCLVMGSGEQQQQAAARVRAEGLENNVLLLGDVSHDTCLTLFARSQVFVRPTFEDGDSISVREALALGVPVVASRVGHRPPGAVLFEPGNVADLLTKINAAWGAFVTA